MSDIKNYNDIIIRDYLDERTTPNRTISAASPDIIPYGQNILSLETATRRYGEILYDPNHAVISGRQCNCYVRGKNISMNSGSGGTVRLFIMPFNVFTNPQNWYQLEAYNSDTGEFDTKVPLVGMRSGNLTPFIDREQVCLNKSAFIINNQYLKNGEHYCLCAVIETESHKITIPHSFESNLEMDRWITTNPNVALLNVYPIALAEQYCNYSFKFGNYDPHMNDFVLKITFGADYDHGESWPSDTAVRIQCTDSRYTFDYDQMKISKYDPAKGDPSITISLDNVPANFYGLCSAFITSKLAMPAHGIVTMSYMGVVNEVPKEYEDLRHHFIPAPELAEKYGKNAYLVRLGNCYAYNRNMSVQKLYEMIQQNSADDSEIE